jgi:hypothetical protein
MSLRTTVAGQLEQRAVDGGTVQALLQANDDLMNYRAWLFLFLGNGLSTAATLFAGVKQPGPIYVLIVVTSALAIGALFLERREAKRVKDRRTDLWATGRQLIFETGPVTGATWPVRVSSGEADAPAVQGSPEQEPAQGNEHT